VVSPEATERKGRKKDSGGKPTRTLITNLISKREGWGQGVVSILSILSKNREREQM